MKRNPFSFVLALCLVSFLFAGNIYGWQLRPLDGTRHYRIYPVPQKIVQIKGYACLYSDRPGDIKTVNIIREPGIDEVTLDRAMQIFSEHGLESVVSDKIEKGGINVLLGIAGSGKLADKTADKLGLDKRIFKYDGYYDKHILCLTNNAWGKDDGTKITAQFLILGENTDAVFCGLASVEQMLD